MKPNLLYIRYYDIHVVPEKMYVYENGFVTFKAGSDREYYL